MLLAMEAVRLTQQAVSAPIHSISLRSPGASESCACLTGPIASFPPALLGQRCGRGLLLAEGMGLEPTTPCGAPDFESYLGMCPLRPGMPPEVCDVFHVRARADYPRLFNHVAYVPRIGYRLATDWPRILAQPPGHSQTVTLPVAMPGRGGGSGLGFLCGEGAIMAASEGLGCGSAFSVRLPLIRTAAIKPPKPLLP